MLPGRKTSVRRARTAESGQGRADIATLRRIRRHARACRAVEISRFAEILNLAARHDSQSASNGRINIGTGAVSSGSALSDIGTGAIGEPGFKLPVLYFLASSLSSMAARVL